MLLHLPLGYHKHEKMNHVVSRGVALWSSFPFYAAATISWRLISRRSAKSRSTKSRLINRVHVLRSFLHPKEATDESSPPTPPTPPSRRRASTKKRPSEWTDYRVEPFGTMSIWKCDILTVIPGRFGVCPPVKPLLRGVVPLTLSRREGHLGRSEAFERARGGYDDEDDEGRKVEDAAPSRSSEIVALPCLRASYRRYLFRRCKTTVPGPVGPASQPVVTV